MNNYTAVTADMHSVIVDGHAEVYAVVVDGGDSCVYTVVIVDRDFEVY